MPMSNEAKLRLLEDAFLRTTAKAGMKTTVRERAVFYAGAASGIWLIGGDQDLAKMIQEHAANQLPAST